MAKLRRHLAGRHPETPKLDGEKPTLQPLPLAGYDISCSRRVRATNRCRVAFESNRYTVPFEHAGALLELRIEPETIAVYRGQKLIAQHPRSYGRNQDIENPDHLSRLLEERKRAEDAALLARFLALSPKAEIYHGAPRQRELHAMGHVRRILLLVDIHGRDAVAQALQEAVDLGAYGSDYLNNILAHRRALAPLSGQLHLTREVELLQLEVQQPDCSRYQVNEQQT
jgi:hypothetical protein